MVDGERRPVALRARPLEDSGRGLVSLERPAQQTDLPAMVAIVLEQAGELARRVQEEVVDDAGRIEWLYRRLYGRAPATQETESGLNYLRAGTTTGGSRQTESAWSGYCHALLCANEFIYVD